VKSPAEIASDVRLFAKYHLVRRVHDHPAREGELGVQLLGYEPVGYCDALTRRPKPVSVRGGFEVEVIDRRQYCGHQLPVHLVRTARANATRTLLVLAGVHGNEQAGLLAVPAIMDAVGRDDLAPNVELRIVTPVNTVGAAVGSRYNADGYDINRDFQRFDTAEARVVRAAFDEQRPDMILSLHEGPQAGTFLFANRRVHEDVATRLLTRIASAGVELADEDYFGRHLDTPGYAPMTPSMWRLSMLWAKTLGMMATGVWADRLGVPEITLESSWRSRDADARIAAHVALVLGALDELS
jgi:Succinylglutamate desuccinylase / Aspartoacylase family